MTLDEHLAKGYDYLTHALVNRGWTPATFAEELRNDANLLADAKKRMAELDILMRSRTAGACYVSAKQHRLLTDALRAVAA